MEILYFVSRKYLYIQKKKTTSKKNFNKYLKKLSEYKSAQFEKIYILKAIQATTAIKYYKKTKKFRKTLK